MAKKIKVPNMSGMLFSLGKMNVGEFVNQAVTGIRAAGKMGASMAYYTQSGEGRLTAALAADAAAYVREALKNPSLRDKRIPASKNWAPLSDDYRAWKDKAFGSLPTLLATSTMADAIGVINRTINKSGGKSTQTVGISVSAKSTVYVRGKLPLTKTSRQVSTTMLARAHEQGRPKTATSSEIPARPFMGPAMTTWVQANFPAWGKLLTKNLTEIYTDEFIKVGGLGSKEKAVSLDTGGIEGGSIDVQAKTMEDASKLTEKEADDMLGLIKKAQSGELDSSIISKLASEVRSTLKGLGRSDEEINQVISTFRKG